MKKNIYLIFVLIIIIAAFAYTFLGDDKAIETKLTTEVQKGEFVIEVVTTGELQAINSNNIRGPQGLRPYDIGQLKILDMVADGTYVDSGDWVAEIDRTPIQTKINQLMTERDKFEAQLIKTRIDTSMEMRAARSEIQNLEWAVDENKIKMEQSEFEPRATQRQAEITYDRSINSLYQARENLSLKKQKNQATISEEMSNYTIADSKLESIKLISDKFTIYAPKPGMVNYINSWRGIREAGSEFDVWDNRVALLPDLSKMKSKTYVNEVDISKVKKGQIVKLVIDAFPDNTYDAEVVDVANVGQMIRSSSAKVFEVTIELRESDSIMKPAMTTQNRILTSSFDSVLFVPMEAVFSNDEHTYVYSEGKRKEVELGLSNANDIIILGGIEVGEKLLLIEPENIEDYKLIELK